MGDSVTELVKETFLDHPDVVAATATPERDIETDSLDWIRGEPSSYSLLVVLDESYTEPTPRAEVQGVSNLLQDAMTDEVYNLTDVEPLGHGVFRDGRREGQVAVAILVG